MNCRKPFLILVAAAHTLIGSQDASAKCAEYKAYYCANAIFEREMPDLSIENFGKQYCMGSIRFGHRSVTAVFMDKQPCPAPGASVVGHLYSLCQDHGKWTHAGYTYTREPDFCTMSYEEGLKDAQETAASIHLGATRPQVHDIMKHYVRMLVPTRPHFDGEEYYVHPDIVLLIPFNEPNGAHSQENEVNGPVSIEREVPPSPVDDESLHTIASSADITQTAAPDRKPVRNIELKESRDIADATAVNHAIDVLLKDAAQCPSNAKDRQVCGCSFKIDLKKLNSAYAAAVAKHPEWNDEDAVVASPKSANGRSTILSLPGVKRMLDGCAKLQQ